jgi:hypothetical protein
MSAILGFVALAASAFASLVLAMKLRSLADREPPDATDRLEATNLYFLNRGARTARGRRLVRWFWVSQFAFFVALVALLVGRSR